MSPHVLFDHEPITGGACSFQGSTRLSIHCRRPWEFQFEIATLPSLSSLLSPSSSSSFDVSSAPGSCLVRACCPSCFVPLFRPRDICLVRVLIAFARLSEVVWVSLPFPFYIHPTLGRPRVCFSCNHGLIPSAADRVFAYWNM